ncbi:hypothetical protein AAVH_16426 [Aphelenchoides avenae]|nr:hypothetical protein AAVH_16426 [Aphelenchus avenae]
MAHSAEDFHEKGLHVLKLNEWPTLDLHGREHIPIGAHITDLKLNVWVVHWVGTCFASIIIVVVVELKIVRYLKRTDISHDATKKMHKEFHRALLAMESLYGFFVEFT